MGFWGLFLAYRFHLSFYFLKYKGRQYFSIQTSFWSSEVFAYEVHLASHGTAQILWSCFGKKSFGRLKAQCISHHSNTSSAKFHSWFHRLAEKNRVTTHFPLFTPIRKLIQFGADTVLRSWQSLLRNLSVVIIFIWLPFACVDNAVNGFSHSLRLFLFI